MVRATLRAMVFGAAFALSAPIASAGPSSIDISAGAQWQSTTDAALGTSWLSGASPSGGAPATAPYPNAFLQQWIADHPGEQPPQDPQKLMWACGGPGAPLCQPFNGMSGPNEAFFALEIAVEGADMEASAAMLADDYMEFYVNGTLVAAFVFDFFQEPGTGVPIVVDVEFSDFLAPGTNVLAIRALDGNILSDGSCPEGSKPTPIALDPGGIFCLRDRGSEYFYFDGVVFAAPEPSALALCLAALVVLRWVRRPDA